MKPADDWEFRNSIAFGKYWTRRSSSGVIVRVGWKYEARAIKDNRVRRFWFLKNAMHWLEEVDRPNIADLIIKSKIHIEPSKFLPCKIKNKDGEEFDCHAMQINQPQISYSYLTKSGPPVLIVSQELFDQIEKTLKE